MTSSRVLFWHRRDLRLADNLGLAAAAEISPAVTGVYVLDPQLINPPPGYIGLTWPPECGRCLTEPSAGLGR